MEPRVAGDFFPHSKPKLPGKTSLVLLSLVVLERLILVGGTSSISVTMSVVFIPEHICSCWVVTQFVWALVGRGTPVTGNNQFLDMSYKRSATPPFLLHNEYVRYNVGVLLVSNTGASFDLEKCAPAVDLALDYVNEVYMSPHGIVLDKVQSR